MKKYEPILVLYMQHLDMPGNAKMLSNQLHNLKEKTGYENMVVINVNSEENVRLELISVEGTKKLDMKLIEEYLTKKEIKL